MSRRIPRFLPPSLPAPPSRCSLFLTALRFFGPSFSLSSFHPFRLYFHIHSVPPGPSRSVPARNVPIRPVPFRARPVPSGTFSHTVPSRTISKPVPYHILHLTVCSLYRTLLYRTVPKPFPPLLPPSQTKAHSPRPSNPTSRVDSSRRARAPVPLSTRPNPQPSCHSMPSSHPHC